MIISQNILDWFKKNGRKDLPWQKNITPYRIWVSEIMLQQTQVSTVIPYFEKFIKQFPDVKSLAKAKEDNVLHLWTGLGYYSRARNLHKAAKIIIKDFKNKFPDNLEDIQTLPGIGRSTAGAIYSIAFKKSAPILDGNVRRVLSRVYCNNGNLWELAEKNTPKKHCEKYTQAIMDLGAMICTRSKPKCVVCPLQKICKAYNTHQILVYPAKKITKILPVKKTILLILKNKSGNILLEKRPSSGIWGGLWSLPGFDNFNEIQKKYGDKIVLLNKLKPFRHTFSHYHLDIFPIEAKASNIKGYWYNPQKPSKVGLPAPIKKILFRE